MTMRKLLGLTVLLIGLAPAISVAVPISFEIKQGGQVVLSGTWDADLGEPGALVLEKKDVSDVGLGKLDGFQLAALKGLKIKVKDSGAIVSRLKYKADSLAGVQKADKDLLRSLTVHFAGGPFGNGAVGVPEPAPILLLGLALLGFAWRPLRRRLSRS